MRTHRLCLSLLGVLFLTLAVSVTDADAASRPSRRSIMEASKPAPIDIVSIDDLMKKQKIKEPIANLKGMRADKTGKHTALIFVDALNTVTVYKDGKLIFDEPLLVVPDSGVFPLVFFFTEQGNLVHALNPFALYVDEKRISSTDNSASYYLSAAGVIESDGKLIFGETHSIREYDLKTRKTKVLYTHPDQYIEIVQKSGNNIVYSAHDARQNHSLFRNGKLFHDGYITNATNFLLTKKGDVYFFSRKLTDEGYALVKNDDVMLSGPGFGGFLFEDNEGNVWTVAYEIFESAEELPLYGTTRADVKIFKGTRQVNSSDIGNMEGSITFGKKNYAFRAASNDHPLDFYLYKNGKRTGEKFRFDFARDGTGIHIAANGKTYMRNYSGKKWELFEDGKRVHNELSNVWYIDTSGKNVKVYATE